jgi:hypothetical protein
MFHNSFSMLELKIRNFLSRFLILIDDLIDDLILFLVTWLDAWVPFRFFIILKDELGIGVTDIWYKFSLNTVILGLYRIRFALFDLFLGFKVFCLFNLLFFARMFV